MAEDVVIRVDSVYKKFKIYFDKSSKLREKVLTWKRNRYEERLVLQGISFSMRRGEALGLIGENGCGKSTTLKLLSRIMYPDAGNIVIKGRVSSLIELGAGFHPDLSGRENIYTNAAIFGLSSKEIDERLQDIIDFSELGDHIDNPVRTYSSGMYMRLAFSVAINVSADILLIDEILAVGDANFQAKCLQRLRDIKANGTTIIIVSHSLGQIEQFCDRTIWISNGQIKMDGKPNTVHLAYLEYMGRKYQQGKEETAVRAMPEEAEAMQERIAWISDVTAIDSLSGNEKNALMVGEPLVLRIHYFADVDRVEEKPIIKVVLLRDETTICEANTENDGVEIRLQEEGIIDIKFDAVTLTAGDYKVNASICTRDSFPYHYLQDAAELYISSDNIETGYVHMAHNWSFSE